MFVGKMSYSQSWITLKKEEIRITFLQKSVAEFVKLCYARFGVKLSYAAYFPPHFLKIHTLVTFTCTKSTIETLEKGVKNVQS